MSNLIAVAAPGRPSGHGRPGRGTTWRRGSAAIPLLSRLLVLVLAGLSTASIALAQEAGAPTEDDATASEGEAARPARGAVVPPPIGVRFPTTLDEDEVRVAYRFERVRLAGLRTGDDSIPPDTARALGFTRTPRSLESTVHTFEVAWAPHPRVTLVAWVPFVQRELSRFDAAVGSRSQVQTEGVGDIGFALVVPFIRKGFEHTQVHVGLDVPTGSFRKSADGQRLPYAAQLGNGSVDLEWGWTYKGELEWASWGGQVVGRHPVGRNGRDWRAGSRFAGSLWGGLRLLGGLSASLRAEWEKQNEIEGFDRDLDPTADPLENPELYDGTRLALAPGLSLEVPALDGQRVGLEIDIPVYQNLDGPQLERDWTFRAGWQWVY